MRFDITFNDCAIKNYVVVVMAYDKRENRYLLYLEDAIDMIRCL